MTSPAAATTSTGAELPLVALPQTELLTVNEGSIPWLSNSLGEGVQLKPLRLDMEAGVWVVLVSFAPGSEVPIHYHTGEAEVFTLSGRWNYKEYPDQPQTAGSYLYEPSGSVHTLMVPADNTEDTLMLVRVRGANVNFNDDGTFHSILDATTLVFLTDLLAQQGGEEVRYLRGGSAAYERAGGPGGTGAAEVPSAIATVLEQG
jgi:quercetin dioxygenase-like cupin family protein